MNRENPVSGVDESCHAKKSAKRGPLSAILVHIGCEEQGLRIG
jgi:hypothetical protein